MYRTLGCLAGAMTGTASLLAWMDPSTSEATRTLSQDELVSLARSLVFDEVPLRPWLWSQVQFVESPAARGAGVLLAADADRSECHFYIDDRGRPSRAGRWDHQLAPSDAPQTIRIAIARNERQSFPTPAQQNSAQALFDALNRAVGSRARTRPSHPYATLAAR